MHRVFLLATTLLFFASCGDKKKSQEAGEAETDEVACEDNSDCEQGEVCLSGACANAASGAIYTDTKNAVTPDKIQNHVDSINENAEKRADEVLGDL